MPKQTICSIVVDAQNGRLSVSAEIEEEEGTRTTAELPQRELSTLLPRSILLGDGMSVSEQMFEVIEETLSRLLAGRRVRIWEYNGKKYFGFLPWRSVKVASAAADPDVPAIHEDGKGG